MADIGLNPPGIRHDRVRGGVATITGIKFGHVVVAENATTNFRDIKLPAGAGAPNVHGVCVTQTDATLGSAVGDDLEICDEGVVEVLLDAGQTVAKDQEVITGATPGTVKPIAAEAMPYTIVGRAAQNATASGSPIRIAVALHIHDRLS